MNPNHSLYDIVATTASLHPENDALFFMGKAVKYPELVARIDTAAAGFEGAGIGAEDVVTVCMPNVFETIYAFYALSKLGAIAHMVHPLTPIAQMRGYMKHADSKMLVILDTMYHTYAPLVDELGVKLVLCSPVSTFSGIKPFAYRLINRKKLKGIAYGERILPFSAFAVGRPAAKTARTDPHAAAVYLHSGGTGGQPKTIELSAFAINTLAFQAQFVMEEPDFNGRHMLAVLPMFHGFGLCMGIHAMLAFGGTDTLMPKFKADETIELIKRNRVNYVIGVPTLFESLLNHPKFQGSHLVHLRRAYVGGDFVATKLKEDFSRVAKAWGSTAELLEGYGLTEMVTVLAVNTPSDRKPDSVGHPLPGIAVKILDVANQSEVPMGVCGEIAVAGDTMMNGYLHDPGATAQTIIELKDGKFLRTGDYGYLDVDGHIHFKQRLKRIVKVSGMPVMPSEIETLVTGMPEILEAAAIGVPDAERGNMIRLFITVKPDHRPGPGDEEIKKRIREHLSVYSIPKQIVRIEKMPRTVVGKIDTNALAKME